MSVPEFYQYYFATVKKFGLMAYTIDKKTSEVKQITQGFPYYFQVFHICYMIMMSFRSIMLLIYNLVAPTISVFQMSVLLLYLIGIVSITAIAIPNLWYAPEIGNLFTALIQLEKQLSHVSYSALNKSKTSWIRLRTVQTSLLRYAYGVSFSVYLAMHVFLPEFPGFSSSLAPRLAETLDDDGYLRSVWANGYTGTFVQILIRAPEVFLLSMAWMYLFSIDLLLGIISSHIGYYLKVILHSSKDSREGMRGFQAIRILVKIINDALAMGLILHMSFMAAVLLGLLYGLILNSGSVLASVFFGGNFICCLVRLLILLIPVADLKGKSEKCLAHFDESIVDPLGRREIKQLSTFCISSGGIYNIDNECLFHFINFLITYFVILSSS